MDFFEHQERARRKTGWLVALFALSLALLVGSVYLVTRALLSAWHRLESSPLAGYGPSSASVQPSSIWDWDPQTFWWVVLITSAIVLAGSIYKVLQLSGGGAAVAESLGGRRVVQATKDRQERQLLNVVAEMAIAAGIPVPRVYVLDHERGINAFAAGFTLHDAAIGVTHGCLRLLGRDELQGVIAHEFSHILNGDMRLNLQLLALVHGMLVIGLTGRIIVRHALYHRPWGFGLRQRDGRVAVGLWGIGFLVMVIGYIGVFFGSMIKAAVSRQREFLADASAVQFTRNPAGITGALKKIGGLAEGSAMRDAKSMAISHMFFSQGFTSMLDTLFATHPPLLPRIRRIEPRFKGRFPAVQALEAPTPEVALTTTKVRRQKPRHAQSTISTRQLPDPIALIGNPTATHVEYASTLMAGLPEPIRAAANDPFGARALLYVLLLSDDAATRGQQLTRLKSHADPAVLDETRRLEKVESEVAGESRLPLLDLTLPTLRELSVRQYGVFRDNVTALADAHGEADSFQWMLRYVLLRHLDPQFRTVKKPIVQYYSLRRLTDPCAIILSALAHASHDSVAHAQRAFNAGVPYLQIEGVALLARGQGGLTEMDRALDTLAQCSPREKRKIIQACAACILADEEVRVQEAELLRAIADALGCPMPPLLPGQAITRTEPGALRQARPIRAPAGSLSP